MKTDLKQKNNQSRKWSLTEDQKRRIGLAKKGIPKTPEHRKAISEARKGFKMSEQQKLKIRETRIGEKHWNWKGGIKLESQRFRVTREYRDFLKGVLERDEFSCRMGDETCEGCLEVHHIYNCMDYPELRYILNNGITLCKKHHPRGRKKEDEMMETFINLISNK